MEAPPYFDVLLDLLHADDQETKLAFGRHVHWGYWEDPSAATGEAADYAEAAEHLCRQVCDEALRAAAFPQALTEQPTAEQLPTRLHNPTLRVLDVGCGFGGTMASLNERYDPLVLTGVNIDERQLDRARREVRSRPGNSIEFVFGDACDLPFGEASFDVVLAVECVFHFDRKRFLYEAARVLAAGGVLAVSDFLPPQNQVSFLKAFDPAQDEATLSTYGAINVLCPLEEYEQWAQSEGLTLNAHRDITPHTMPTYAFLRKHAQQWKDAQQSEHFDRATARLETASRTGLLRYEIVVFEKGSQ